MSLLRNPFDQVLCLTLFVMPCPVRYSEPIREKAGFLYERVESQRSAEDTWNMGSLKSDACPTSTRHLRVVASAQDQ